MWIFCFEHFLLPGMSSGMNTLYGGQSWDDQVVSFDKDRENQFLYHKNPFFLSDEIISQKFIWNYPFWDDDLFEIKQANP